MKFCLAIGVLIASVPGWASTRLVGHRSVVNVTGICSVNWYNSRILSAQSYRLEPVATYSGTACELYGALVITRSTLGTKVVPTSFNQIGKRCFTHNLFSITFPGPGGVPHDSVSFEGSGQWFQPGAFDLKPTRSGFEAYLYWQGACYQGQCGGGVGSAIPASGSYHVAIDDASGQVRYSIYGQVGSPKPPRETGVPAWNNEAYLECQYSGY